MLTSEIRIDIDRNNKVKVIATHLPSGKEAVAIAGTETRALQLATDRLERMTRDVRSDMGRGDRKQP